jgi:hypothetical protein
MVLAVIHGKGAAMPHHFFSRRLKIFKREIITILKVVV